MNYYFWFRLKKNLFWVKDETDGRSYTTFFTLFLNFDISRPWWCCVEKKCTKFYSSAISIKYSPIISTIFCNKWTNYIRKISLARTFLLLVTLGTISLASSAVMNMGWVNRWVGLGWVRTASLSRELGWVEKVMGWVGLGCRKWTHAVAHVCSSAVIR